MERKCRSAAHQKNRIPYLKEIGVAQEMEQRASVAEARRRIAPNRAEPWAIAQRACSKQQFAGLAFADSPESGRCAACLTTSAPRFEVSQKTSSSKGPLDVVREKETSTRKSDEDCLKQAAAATSFKVKGRAAHARALWLKSLRNSNCCQHHTLARTPHKNPHHTELRVPFQFQKLECPKHL